MNGFSLLYWIAISLIVAIELFLVLYLFVKFILIPYKKSTETEDVESLFNTLKIIMNEEIQTYEQSIFNNGGGVVSNASFDNYYRDLCARIYNDMSPDLISKFTKYITEDGLAKFIATVVSNYLRSKII